MKYYSTNKNTANVSLKDALFMGQAPDKGLFLPETIPTFSPDEINALAALPYYKIAYNVLSKYVLDTFDKNTLLNLSKDAYNYDIPLEQIKHKTFVMRLDQGPTASFKDFAARMMARMLGALMKDSGEELIILTATSGDTGSAIAQAFYNVENVKVMVLFPKDEVSIRQRKQMTTLGNNIQIVAVDGKFDDCQAMAKHAFADKDIKDINLTSANSINIGRILPQIIYYFYAYAQLAQNMEKIFFVIPSGNFGNMMGAVIAKRMGLPIERLIIATNENDEVPKFLETATYQKIEPSKVCLSNAMNVGHPSNFARLIDLYGGQIDEQGNIKKNPDINKLRKDISTSSVTDTETRNTIKKAWDKYKLLLEPHGAVAWTALEEYSRSNNVSDKLIVALETAHPAKFPEEIESLLDFSPEVPESIASLDDKEEEYLHIKSDYNELKNMLIDKYRS